MKKRKEKEIKRTYLKYELNMIIIFTDNITFYKIIDILIKLKNN